MWAAAQIWGPFLTQESAMSSLKLRGSCELIGCVCVHFHLQESHSRRRCEFSAATSIMGMTRDFLGVDCTKGPFLHFPSTQPECRGHRGHVTHGPVSGSPALATVIFGERAALL